MTITAQVIADSISPQDIRLTTFQLRYPRFIHSEVMTHRVFSRNASSSRAVPVAKLIEDIRRDPAMPIHWGKNQPGMQAYAEHSAPITCPTWSGGVMDQDPIHAWRLALEHAVVFAQAFAKAGYHKQIVNRVLEPFAHINVVLTGTNFANFYALRRHSDAQPEIKALADAMWDAQLLSKPVLLQHSEWHVPYYEQGVWQQHASDWDVYGRTLIEAQKISTARCARVSYLTHDGRPTTVEEDLALYDRLVGSMPLHASPAEHQATPDEFQEHGSYWFNKEQWGNFRGWVQFRKTLSGEFTAN